MVVHGVKSFRCTAVWMKSLIGYDVAVAMLKVTSSDLSKMYHLFCLKALSLFTCYFCYRCYLNSNSCYTLENNHRFH